MPKQGLNPDVVTYNTLMNELCKMGNVKEAIKLFQQMKGSNVVPNVITYSTLMDGLSKEGMIQEANCLLLDLL